MRKEVLRKWRSARAATPCAGALSGYGPPWMKPAVTSVTAAMAMRRCETGRLSAWKSCGGSSRSMPRERSGPTARSMTRSAARPIRVACGWKETIDFGSEAMSAFLSSAGPPPGSASAVKIASADPDGGRSSGEDEKGERPMKLRYFYPLVGFVVPTLAIGYGLVIPRSCIAGLNDLTIGFATTVLGAGLTYWYGLQTVVRDLRPPH